MCRNGDDEVEGVLVDDPLPDVEQLRLQACNTPGETISSQYHVTHKAEKQPGLSTRQTCGNGTCIRRKIWLHRNTSLSPRTCSDEPRKITLNVQKLVNRDRESLAEHTRIAFWSHKLVPNKKELSPTVHNACAEYLNALQGKKLPPVLYRRKVNKLDPARPVLTNA